MFGETFSCSNAEAKSQVFESSLVRRDPINLFLHCPLLDESSALQNRLAVLDHVRMPAQIRHGIARLKIPLICVLAENVIRSADLAVPLRVVPRTAHSRNILEPRQLSFE